MRQTAWIHGFLTAYVWLMAWAPLGRWNPQRGEHILPALIAVRLPDTLELVLLALLTLPAILTWIACRRNSLWFLIPGLLLDAVWLAIEAEFQWLPYLLGTDKVGHREYARFASTHILPSFGFHIAPDGMHTVIGILLPLAFVSGIIAFCRAISIRRAAA